MLDEGGGTHISRDNVRSCRTSRWNGGVVKIVRRRCSNCKADRCAATLVNLKPQHRWHDWQQDDQRDYLSSAGSKRTFGRSNNSQDTSTWPKSLGLSGIRSKLSVREASFWAVSQLWSRPLVSHLTQRDWREDSPTGCTTATLLTQSGRRGATWRADWHKDRWWGYGRI